jgi:mannose-6-phosphate isomerase-like protein (cupin superfamily)
LSDHVFDPTQVASFRDDKMNKINLFESPHLFCDVYCLKPGQSQKVHSHAHNDKIYYTVSGSAFVTLGDETLPLPCGHVAIAPAGVPHGVENRSDANCTLLVLMAPNPNRRP